MALAYHIRATSTYSLEPVTEPGNYAGAKLHSQELLSSAGEPNVVSAPSRLSSLKATGLFTVLQMLEAAHLGLLGSDVTRAANSVCKSQVAASDQMAGHSCLTLTHARRTPEVGAVHQSQVLQ
jgi:hypothetical protein